MSVRGGDVRPDVAALPWTDAWTLAWEEWTPDSEGLREALCALGNGRFVTRGAAEDSEADGVHYPGTYVAGGYNRLTSEVAGRSVVNEDLVNFPNWLPLTFRPEDGTWLAPGSVELLSWRQELKLDEGLLVRRLRFRDADGRDSLVETRRLVSMARPHLAAIEYRITPQNWEGRIRIRSGIDGSVRNTGVARYRELESRHLETVARGGVSPDGIYLVARTTQSRFEVGLAARTRLFGDGEGIDGERRVVDEDDDRIAEEIRVAVQRGTTLRVEKTVALFATNDRGTGEPGLEARHVVRAAGGFGELHGEHRRAWHALWRRYDVEIGDDSSATGLVREQVVLRLHIFQVLQAVSPHTVGLDVGAPARGLHGEAYRGHIFWDELFVLPFFNLRQPAITRSLLLYRYYRLDSARQLARAEGLEGAMYPWQSSHDGREATQEVHLNPMSGEWGPDWSRLQRHVNAAIVYNTWRYWQATDDRSFLRDFGAEMLLEIARFWSSLATWSEERRHYQIAGVMGPDEYHEKYPGAESGGLRNNAYTNVVATWCLRRALDVLDIVGAARRDELLAALRITASELERWSDIAGKMFVPFTDGDVIEQFEGYAELEPFDWEGYRERYGDIERLDRILKAEGDTPDRFQVSKQADATMLLYLFDPDPLKRMLSLMGYSVQPGAMTRTLDYYRTRTSHGSTLSKLVFASVMHHVDAEEGYRLFLEALRGDIDDVQGGTTPEGIHLGLMAGTIGMVLRRYAGVELRAEGVCFDPGLPPPLGRIRCRVAWRDRWLDVELTRTHLRLTADGDEPDPVPVRVRGEWYLVGAGETLEADV